MVEISVFTNHKPLIRAFTNSIPKISDKQQQQQLSFISDFVLDIVHISGKYIIVADTLSRNINTSTLDTDQSNDATDLLAISTTK